MSLRPYRDIHRRASRQIHVGPVAVGGGAPISVQSMTNTVTGDITATTNQVRALEEAGADIVRVSCPDHESTQALAKIVKAVGVPIIADIHFHHKRAIEAAEAGSELMPMEGFSLRGMLLEQPPEDEEEDEPAEDEEEPADEPEDEEEEEPVEEEPEDDETIGSEERTVEEPEKPTPPQLDMDNFTSSVVNLIDNHDNLLNVVPVIVSRAKNILSENYGVNTISEFEEILEREFGITPDGQEAEEDLPPAPPADGAGPLGGA